MPLEPAAGGPRKFLYTSTSSIKNTESDQWSFGAAKPTNQQSPRGISIDLNNAWSIKNVGLTARNTSSGLPKSELNKNVPAGFYSRHGGLNGHAGVANNVGAFGKSSGGQWVSSGHNFSQASQMMSSTGTPPPQSSGSTRRKQNYSPLDNDANDF